MAKPTTKIDAAALKHLASLQANTQAEFGIPATYQHIVSALVLGTTVPQLAGILLDYHKQTAHAIDEGSEDEESA